jgi:phosphonate transport system ATP-binding protein
VSAQVTEGPADDHRCRRGTCAEQALLSTVRHSIASVCVSTRGEMVALIGASGSGKSTLMRHLSGFIAADSGSVEVFGREIQRDGRIARDIRDTRAGIGFVFQQFNLVNRLPVMTNVLIGLLRRTSLWRSLLMRFSMAERQQALEALVAVGIEQTAWQRASTLSGGQQQRAALARCLVQGARVVLADEPIASLDPESSRKVMELLAEMNRERGCTVLVSLHQVEFAIRYCPRTVALHRGIVVYDGPSSALTPALLSEALRRRCPGPVRSRGRCAQPRERWLPLTLPVSAASLPRTPSATSIASAQRKHHARLTSDPCSPPPPWCLTGRPGGRPHRTQLRHHRHREGWRTQADVGALPRRHEQGRGRQGQRFLRHRLRRHHRGPALQQGPDRLVWQQVGDRCG